MSETVKVLCYKSKTLSDGKHPLMVRVCKDGKKKYQSLGISIHPTHWDFKKKEPNEFCPNRDETDFLRQADFIAVKMLLPVEKPDKPMPFIEEPTFANVEISTLKAPALLKYLADRGIPMTQSCWAVSPITAGLEW